MDLWILLLQLSFLLLLLYFYIQKKFAYWSSRGVPGPTPTIFNFGNVLERLRFSPDQYELDYLKKYGRFYGRFRGLMPTLNVADAELLKQIMIKDFHLFMNKTKLKTYDELWNQNLFNAEGDSWKRIRTITSPTFTSGKLRGMHKLMNGCIQKFVAYLDKISNEGNGVIDTKKVIAGFTIDVIALTSFATETNANDDRNQPSPVVENGINMFFFNPLRIFCFFIFPRSINNLLNVKYQFSPKYFNYFRDLVKEIVRQRRQGNVSKRNDFVQMLMDAYVYENELKDTSFEQLEANMDKEEINEEQKQKNMAKKTLTDSEVIAQCILFFIAGFETTGSTLTNCLFEFARNPDIQERLNTELNRALNGLDVASEEYYDTVLTKIPYLDAVIKETLRKYPPVNRLDRRVGVAGYKLGGITLEKEQQIEVPTYVVHHDPEYYPDPERFNPDRFMPENKHLLVPYTYIPFGIGPRNCVGMRFAYQEIKLLLAQIVTKFVFSQTPETPEKLRFKSATIMLTTYPFPIKVTQRL